MEIKGLTKLKFRERNIFDEHDHGHKEDDHDDHAKKRTIMMTTTTIKRKGTWS